MRILALNWQDRKHPLAGGAEVHLHEILSRLGHAGHDIVLLCSRFAGAPPEERYDRMRVVRVGGRNTFNWTVPGAARRLLKQQRFDVVIDDINKIPFFSKRFATAPVLGIVHHLFGTAIYREVNPLAASYVYFMESLVPRRYRDVPMMVVSESTRDDLVRRGMNAAMIRVVHNGIDHTRYRPDAAVAKSPTPMLSYLGRIKRYKSIDHLFSAASLLRDRFPGLSIHIIGAGDDMPRLQSVARHTAMDNCVTFHGFLDAEEKIRLIRRSWAVVCPSLKEGWGLTNIEANACGTPVVCADVPGLRDSVRAGETGLLYPYGDIASLTDRLGLILSDAALRDRLATGALEWAARFNWDAAARDTEEILQAVAAGTTQIALKRETVRAA